MDIRYFSKTLQGAALPLPAQSLILLGPSNFQRHVSPYVALNKHPRVHDETLFCDELGLILHQNSLNKNINIPCIFSDALRIPYDSFDVLFRYAVLFGRYAEVPLTVLSQSEYLWIALLQDILPHLSVTIQFQSQCIYCLYIRYNGQESKPVTLNTLQASWLFGQ
ncbi:MAG: hypothetical protein KC582_00525 [Candidatus Magasanikbacteria bacterium]|nr:hypothetical protein [Candidatus Magasanikbacteria bacterium]USN52284.1 MAG: hypothetical protein H6759_04670 [Candidatus Nomurabacteria bacterium]